MRVIIAGSRSITSLAEVELAVALSHFHITEIVSGGARGVDKLGEEYAAAHGIPVKPFYVTDAQWKASRGAGFQRNTRMVAYAEALIAIYDGSSKGTMHMINTARARRLLVYVHRPE